MKMITLLLQRQIQISILGGKVITVHETLVLIVTGHTKIFLTLTSSQVLILTQLYGIMSKNLGFMAAIKKVGSTQE
jgi:hydrogenase maturation factor